MSEKVIIGALEACAIAAQWVRSAGFECRYVSRRSEASYYAIPGDDRLIRIASHQGGPQSNSAVGLITGKVVAKITLSPNGAQAPAGALKISHDKIREIAARAIGTYMLAPKFVARQKESCDA